MKRNRVLAVWRRQLRDGAGFGRGHVIGSWLVLVMLAACQATVPPVAQPTQPPPEEAPSPPPPPPVTVEQVPPPAAVLQAPFGGPSPVALLLPLSGGNAKIGQAMRNAAELALFETGSDDLVLVPIDTAGDAPTAAAAMDKALARGARLVLGPVFGSMVPAVAPAATARGVSLVAFTNDRKVARDGIFVFGLTPEQQVDRVTRHAFANGISRFAALVPENVYGNAVVEALFATAREIGGEVDRVEFFPANALDLTEPVRRLATAPGQGPAGRPFDGLLIAAGGAQLRAIGPLISYFDLDTAGVKLLGTQLWEDPAILGEPNLVGGWFAAPPRQARAAFEQRYKRAFGETPPAIAALAFDAVALAAALAKRGDFSPQALTQPDGFIGVNGLFRFTANGNAERGLAVFGVEPGGFTLIEDAPASLGPPTF